MSKKERIWFLFAAITLPLFMWLYNFQVSRYQNLRLEISKLDQFQRDCYEENQKLVSAIAHYNSPSRISNYAESKLAMSKDEQRSVIRIVIK